MLSSSCVFVVLRPCCLRCIPVLDFCSGLWRTSSAIRPDRGLQMLHALQRTRAPVTLIPTYEGVAHKRRGGWVAVVMVSICKHGLHRTSYHRCCNKLRRVDHQNHAVSPRATVASSGPPPISYLRHCSLAFRKCRGGRVSIYWPKNL